MPIVRSLFFSFQADNPLSSVSAAVTAGGGGGYVTDEELELCQTISEVTDNAASTAAANKTPNNQNASSKPKPKSGGGGKSGGKTNRKSSSSSLSKQHLHETPVRPSVGGGGFSPPQAAVPLPPVAFASTPEDLQSPSREVLIADNGSRR